MKNLLSLLVLLPMMVVGQTQTENYIKTTTYKVASTTNIASPTITQANQNITYFDGLGRPIQQIANQQSGSGKDIVTPIEYDAFGRQPIDYLPYVPTSSTSLDYKSTALTDVLNFPQYLGQNPYSQKEFEPSPLNRVLRQAAPGTDWALNSGHEIKLDYQTNVANEVKLFTATAAWNSSSSLYDISLGNASGATFYNPNQLYKTITYDENTAATPTESNGSTVEFKNKEGQVVLKRTYDNTIAHDTYYIYDEYGNLTFVIPPKADSAITTAILDDLCYQYKYDYRNRLVEKKLPGKQWEFIVYDKLDRVVATGPAFSPFSDSALGALGWIISKYDALNRVVYTGWELSATITPADRKTKQNTMDSLATLSESKTATPTAIDSLTGIAYYTNNVAPTSFKLLTINYYDDYDFQAFTPAIAYTAPVAYNNSTLKPKGLSTGSWVRVLTTLSATTAESSYILYDAKARPVKTFSTNYLGGYTQIDSNLDAFSGRLNYSETRHKRVSGDPELYIKEAYTYSDQNRLMTHTHQIGLGATPQLLAENTYDELGRLISKNVGNTTVAPLQKVDYAYNIRGWLTEINKVAALQQGSDPKDLFGFKINYNTIDGDASITNKLYNGNIAETSWSSSSVVRTYGYKYDNLNRLKEATYQKPKSSNPVPRSYDENIYYDKNGNITYLSRNGDVEDALPAIGIDYLSYFYALNSNKLLGVRDYSNSTSGFKDGETYNSDDDYSYDANGNMIADKNKKIIEIVYNHLNLPTKISFASVSNVIQSISYIYNATGQKLLKQVYYISGYRTQTTTTDYLSDFQYKTESTYSGSTFGLQFFPQAEGYVDCSSGTFNYIYQYKDHLGNIRLSYQDKNNNGTIDTGEILEENNYYPFGLKHKGYNDYTSTNYKYKYNGKELQDELGLNVYDYGARNYDPALGRWMNIDPLAEQSRKWSPYTYCMNNPVFFIDPDGMSADWHRDSSGTLTADTGDTAESLAKFKGISVQEARAEFNHSHYRYESVMSGGEKLYQSDRAISSGDYGPSYGPEKDAKISLAITGIIAAPVLGASGALGAGASYLWSGATAAISQVTWGSAATGIATNTLSQGVANGGDMSKVNVVEALSSAIPGVGSTVVGETFNLPVSSIMQGNFVPSLPQSIDQGVLQIGGGLISNKFGNKIDANVNFSSGVGKTYGVMAKFTVETGSNVAPSLANKK